MLLLQGLKRAVIVSCPTGGTYQKTGILSPKGVLPQIAGLGGMYQAARSAFQDGSRDLHVCFVPQLQHVIFQHHLGAVEELDFTYHHRTMYIYQIC